MKKDKLLKYKDFEIRLSKAALDNSYESFIIDLKGLLEKGLNVYLSKLFLARCYVNLESVALAKEYYKDALKIAKDPNWLSKEVNEYFDQNKVISLEDAEHLFHKNLVLDPSQEKLETFNRIYIESSFRSEYFIHQYIILLHRLKEFNRALQVINNIITTDIPLEQRSRYLLLKAQISSSLNNYQMAVEAYLDLIETNQKIGAKDSNLGHLFFEIARIYVRLGKFSDALNSAEQAYIYTPTDTIKSFLESLNRIDNIEVEVDDFSIEIIDDQIDIISPMLKFDIEDFDYRDNIIIKNGKVSIDDAERIYKKAKDNITKDLSLVYPLYLEAAKAFNDISPGTYNHKNFIDSLAKYSTHKSSAIFYTYRQELNNPLPDSNTLKRLKDSACSYIETSINLENDTRKLLFLLSNYLKIVISYTLYKQQDQRFKDIFRLGYFNQIISYCVNDSNRDVLLKTYQAIIHFGSVSIRIWDRISRLSKDTEKFYNYLKTLHNPTAKKTLVDHLNSYENIKVDSSLNVAQVFYRYIDNRKKQKQKFETNFSQLRSIPFVPKNIATVTEKWSAIKVDNILFSETDIEISVSVDSILKNYVPYLERTISERTNILFQVRTAIDKQLSFIVNNTTYWGRAMFFPLLKKWKADINKLESERVSQTIPFLTVITDPGYIFKKNDNHYVNLVIKNMGQSTASSFIMKLDATKLDGQPIDQIETRFNNEIIVNGTFPIEITISNDIAISEKAIKLNVQVNPIYQDREISQLATEFTLEKETQSFLEIEHIPWNETKIPRQHLFKGREKLIKLLGTHYKSVNRDKTYILYGLTRTGKSSVLRYLEKELENQLIKIEGKEKTVISFFWDLSEASGQSNAQDLWAFLLYDNTISKIESLVENGLIPHEVCPAINAKPRFKDWKKIIEHLNEKAFYPLFVIDEFAYYKLLHDNGRLDQSFLAAIRQYALNGIASFIFAGTYDLKELIKNPQYGITGQLTNTVERLISNIEIAPARELITVISDKLDFTEEAISHILFLTGRIPYFIQIVCKNCGYYAVENRRKILGYPEVEAVVKILIGEERAKTEDSLITILSAGTFQNNQYSPTDNKEVQSLISSICFKNRYKVKPRGVSYAELQELWSTREITGFAPKLAEAIGYLRDKEIIEEKEDENIAVYLIKVDLFRRWWENQHRDIDLELDILRER